MIRSRKPTCRTTPVAISWRRGQSLHRRASAWQPRSRTRGRFNSNFGSGSSQVLRRRRGWSTSPPSIPFLEDLMCVSDYRTVAGTALITLAVSLPLAVGQSQDRAGQNPASAPAGGGRAGGGGGRGGGGAAPADYKPSLRSDAAKPLLNP